MRVVITGGSGLIGQALSPHLVARGDEVVWLTREPDRLGSLPPGVRALRWDGRTAAGWADLLTAASDRPEHEVAIVQLAGENLASGRWTAARKERLAASRLLAGAAVVAAVAQASRPPAVVIQASGVSYYGVGVEPVGEEAPNGGGFLADLAREWEASTAAVEQQGVRRVVARLGVVLARQGGALPKLLPPFRLGLGGRLGDGRQWMSWIHLDDLSAALLWLLSSGTARGPFNLTSPQPVSNRDFTRAVGRALDRPAPFVVPAFGLRLALGEMADTLLTGQRAVPRRLEAAGFRFSWGDLDAALRSLLG